MLTVLTLAVAMSSPAPGDAAVIRALRAASNAGLAARDAERVVAPFAENILSVAGNGARTEGREAVSAHYRAQVGPGGAFVSGLRTPGRIALDRSGGRASEPGRWRWVVRTPHGEAAYSGDYLADWVKRGGAWRLQTELFITIGCSGPGCAPEPSR